MNIEEILKKVKAAFTNQPETENMAEAALEDGTQITAEAFEVGQIVYVKTEEEQFVVLTAGEYTLADGTKITVDEEGKITEMEGAEAAEDDEVMKDKDKDKDKDEMYVTQDQLNDFGNKILEGVADILKVVNSSQKKTELSEAEKAKIEAAKQEFATRRKKIENKADDKKKAAPKAEEIVHERDFRHPYVNPAKARVQGLFKDFEFKN